MSLGCNTAKAGTQEAVFCQVQKFPRIVVIPKAYGYLETLELNPWPALRSRRRLAATATSVFPLAFKASSRVKV